MVFDIQWQVAGETQLRRRFLRIETALDDFTEPLTKAREVVEEETQHQFDVEGNPRWEPLSEGYAKRKRRLFGFTHMLVATGALFASLVRSFAEGAISVVTKTEMRRGSSLQVGTKRRYNLALIHFAGAEKAGIPARQMMRLRPRAQSRIVGFFHRHLFEQGELSSIYTG